MLRVGPADNLKQSITTTDCQGLPSKQRVYLRADRADPLRGRFRTAPVITVFTPVTALKTSHL